MSDEEKRTVMRRLERRFGSGVDVSIDTRDEEVLYDFTTAVLSSVGTVVVSNPRLVEDVIEFVYESERIRLDE